MMAIWEREKGVLEIGSREIEYSIIRSKKRKRTVTLRVEPGVLTILAPANTKLDKIVFIAEQRKAWIIKKLAGVENNFFERPPREFITGETLLYLGRQYRLRLSNANDGNAFCKLKGGWLEICLSDNLGKDERQYMIWWMLVRWYRSQAQQKLSARLDAWSKKSDLRYNKFLLSSPTGRWGSCDTHNNIRLNWRIIMAPMSLVDYVVAHELCHLIHRNHSEDFWRLLGTIMPDYDLRRQNLKKLGGDYSL